MNAQITITLKDHRLELRCPAANVREELALGGNETARLQAWTARHRALAFKEDAAPQDLLQIGQEMFEWLSGPTQFLKALPNAVSAPLLVEFAVDKTDDSKEARAFLDAPWELLAFGGRRWALRGDILFCPIRRIGKSLQPPPPSPDCLSLVFMAAAPRDAGNLNYEAEEAAILKATRNLTLSLDLIVEESGTLDLLSAAVSRERPHVVQISCHGSLKPEPGLLLEDEVGDEAFVTAGKLIRKLASHHPRLLFLSACETAEAHPFLDSLAWTLTRSGVPAALGWAAPMRDLEATVFTGGLYGHLTRGEDLAHALAYARLELDESEELPEPPFPGPRSRGWHLARLYLASDGGGALATAGGQSRLMGRGLAIKKAFLDKKGQRVEVASEFEFVGRRRHIQDVLKEFRAPASQRHAGVFIHGMGRQGKSSLAARVAQRLEHSHDVVVVYERYDAPSILMAFASQIATPAVTEIVNRRLPEVEQKPANLLPALMELLTGPCAQKNTPGAPNARPVLLVVDDFEQVLEERKDGPHCLKTLEIAESIRAVIQAFHTAATDSRLLFTCRVQFTLPTDGKDLAERLLPLPLHGMNERDSRKQAVAKLRSKLGEKSAKAANVLQLVARLDRIITAAQGNPGLQDILFNLCLENPAACDRCLQQMEEYNKTGKKPDEETARKFLENLAIGALLNLLAPGHRELLRASTLFALPVRAAVLEKMERVQGASQSSGLRWLVDLGLWEVYEDMYDPHARAFAVNALARPLAGELSEMEGKKWAAVTSLPLFQEWGGEEGGKQRHFLLDYELTRLALLARAPRVLASAAAPALRFLERRQFAYRQAAAWAKEIMAILDQAGVPASVDLLRTAAESCVRVGDVSDANVLLGRAIEDIRKAQERGESVDVIHHAVTLITYGRLLANQGQPDEALKYLEQARAMLPPGREKAIVMGEIARIRADKGEVDAALELHQERLKIFEELGDKRSRAVTLGDIAGILRNKGEVEAALKLLQEARGIFEKLGDKRSRAVTLGDIARILRAKGEVDVALELHQERLAVFEELGDKRERAITLGDIARIRADKGEVDAALKLLQEAQEIFVELGDRRSRAGSLWDIGGILRGKGNVDAALKSLQEAQKIFEELGDRRSRAGALGEIARIRADRGEVDAALEFHQEQLAVYEELGGKRARAVVLGEIARILRNKGDMDAALKLHQEELAVYEELGNKRERAVTLGDIARIRANKGEVDAALKLLQEALAVYEEQGYSDGIGNTLWSIARWNCGKGNLRRLLSTYPSPTRSTCS